MRLFLRFIFLSCTIKFLKQSLTNAVFSFRSKSVTKFSSNCGLFKHWITLEESHSVFTRLPYQQAISRVDSRPKLERYLKRFCRRLICCEFFLSLKPVPTPCPDQCQADGKYSSALSLAKCSTVSSFSTPTVRLTEVSGLWSVYLQ